MAPFHTFCWPGNFKSEKYGRQYVIDWPVGFSSNYNEPTPHKDNGNLKMAVKNIKILVESFTKNQQLKINLFGLSHISVLSQDLVTLFLQLRRDSGSSTALRKMGYFSMRVNLVFTSILVSSRISFNMTLSLIRCQRMKFWIYGNDRNALKVCSLTFRLLFSRSIIQWMGYSSILYSKNWVRDDSVRTVLMRFSHSWVMCLVWRQAGGAFWSSWQDIRWVYWQMCRQGRRWHS